MGQPRRGGVEKVVTSVRNGRWKRCLRNWFLFFAFIIVVNKACSIIEYESWSWRQKLTIAVQTPEGVKKAFSVTRVFVEDTQGRIVPNEARGPRAGESGEAVVMQLAPKKYLFALLKVNPETVTVLFPPRQDYLEALDQIDSLRGKPRIVPRKLYPDFVTFDDIDDPITIRRVNPDDLAAIFGVGFSLLSMSLEITDEPVTRGEVEKVLPAMFFQRWSAFFREAGRQGGIDHPFYKTLLSRFSQIDFIRN